MKINIIDILEGLTKFTETYFGCFLFLSPHTTSALKIESQTKEQGHTLHQLLSTEPAVLFPRVKLCEVCRADSQCPQPVSIGAGHSSPLSPLTPSPALVPGAARQHCNTLGTPSAIHLLFTGSLFTTNAVLLSQIHKYPPGLTVCPWFL